MDHMRTWSAFPLYGKTGKNFRVKGTGKFSSVKMERDERVPFTPSYVKKTLNPPNSNINKTPRGVSVGCIGLRIASQGQDE